MHLQRCGTCSAAAEARAHCRPTHTARIIYTTRMCSTRWHVIKWRASEGALQQAHASRHRRSSPLGADHDAPAAAAFTRALHYAGHTLNDDLLVVHIMAKKVRDIMLCTATTMLEHHLGSPFTHRNSKKWRECRSHPSPHVPYQHTQRRRGNSLLLDFAHALARRAQDDACGRVSAHAAARGGANVLHQHRNYKQPDAASACATAEAPMSSAAVAAPAAES